MTDIHLKNESEDDQEFSHFIRNMLHVQVDKKAEIITDEKITNIQN